MRRKKAPVKYWIPEFRYYLCSVLRLRLGPVRMWPTQRPHKNIRAEIAAYLTGWYETRFGIRYEFGQETVDLWCSILVAGHAGKTISSGQVNRYDELIEQALRVQLFYERPPDPKITGPLRRKQMPEWAVQAASVQEVLSAASGPRSLRGAIYRLRSLIAPR